MQPTLLHRVAVRCSLFALYNTSLCLYTPASAGYVVLMGDATPTFALQYDSSEGYEGNRAFFRNLVGGGDSVLLLSPSHGNASLVRDFFNRLHPGSSALTSATLSDELLQDVDLLVASRIIREYSPSEVDAISNLLGRGGNLLVIVEPPPSADAEPVRSSVHALLDKLRVNMRLVNPLFDVGSNVASGERIRLHPLTVGVTTFNYGWASNIQGGTPLLISTTSHPFASAVFVPESSTFVMAVISLLAVTLARGCRCCCPLPGPA